MNHTIPYIPIILSEGCQQRDVMRLPTEGWQDKIADKIHKRLLQQTPTRSKLTTRTLEKCVTSVQS